MAGNGGRREGAGRKRGSQNKTRDEVRVLLDKVVDFRKVVGRLFELSQGVEVQKFDKHGNPTIYSEKPDAFASKILLEYRFGKPLQPFEGEFESEILVKFKDE